MNTTPTAQKSIARIMIRRVAAGATLVVAPILIALGAATVAHADTDAPVHPRTNQEIQQSYGPHASMSHHQKRYYPY